MKFNSMLPAVMVAMVLGLVTLSRSTNAESTVTKSDESKIFERTATCMKIGKASNYATAASTVLTVYLPLDVEIVDVDAYIGYLPWGEGESDYGNDNFTKAPLNNYENESGEWHKSWAKASLIEINSNENAQWVKIRVKSWKHDNSRKAKLVVKFRRI